MLKKLQTEHFRSLMSNSKNNKLCDDVLSPTSNLVDQQQRQRQRQNHREGKGSAKSALRRPASAASARSRSKVKGSDIDVASCRPPPPLKEGVLYSLYLLYDFIRIYLARY